MTDAKPVQKKQPLRILILWNRHEEASQPSEEAGPARTAAPKDAAETGAADKDAAAQGAADKDAAEQSPQPAATETVAQGGRVPRQVDEIASVLRQYEYRVFVFDLEDDPTRIVDAITVVRPSLIFNLVDAFYGDTTQHATVAAYFDLLGVPYTGSDPLCLATSQDRVRVHLLLDNAGIPVPRFEVIRDVNVTPDTDDFRFPIIVTQAFDDLYEEEGEERPISDRDELVASSAALFKEFDLPYLVEEYIGHRRLHAIVLGNRVLEVLPLVELSAGDEAGAGAPWALAQLDYDTADRVRQLARRAFRVMGCRDMAQIDFHLDEDDVPYVVDVRPMFEMGPGSVFWGATEHTARGYAEVLAELVKITCKRANLDQPAAQAAEPHLPDIQLPNTPTPEPEPEPAPSEPAEPPAAEAKEAEGAAAPEDEELEDEELEDEELEEDLEAEDEEDLEAETEEDLEAEDEEDLEAEDEEPAVNADSTERPE